MDCEDKNCSDGIVHGWDANGSEIVEACPDPVHKKYPPLWGPLGGHAHA